MKRVCVLWLAAVWTAGATSGTLGAPGNELTNPGFEQTEAGKLVGWKMYGRGCTLDSKVVHSGKRAIRCEATGKRDARGVTQVIEYATPDKRPVILGGWCKTQDVLPGGDCSVYLDIIYADGSPWWGLTNRWQRGTHDWQYDTRIVYPAKPIKEIRAYVFLRWTSGVAWFDEVKVQRGGLDITGLRVASDFPHSFGAFVTAGLTAPAEWTCTLVRPGGTVLASRKGSGKDIRWRWEGGEAVKKIVAKLEAATPAGERTSLEVTTRLRGWKKNPVRKGYAVWIQSAMKKVYPDEFPRRWPGAPQVSVALARGERESVQLALTPADTVTLKHVEIRVGTLRQKNGAVFPRRNITARVVGYVWVDGPSGHPRAPDYPNWCPDPLLPLKPFSVRGGSTQAVWVTFFASPETPSGEYHGTITVVPTNAPPTTMSVRVRVLPFTLARRPHMKTAFALMEGFLRRTYGEVSPALRRKCTDLMLEHRLNPDDISRTEPPPISELLYARAHGMNTFNILNLVPEPKPDPKRLWVCYAPKSAYGPGFTAELARRLDPYVAELRRHGLAKIAYVYGFDERPEDYDEIIKRVCRFIKKRYPEVHTFTTAGYMYLRRAKVPVDYEDFLDWYCPLTARYDPDLSAKLRSAGKQVWWYVCCGPRFPYANFASMDYPSLEGRLLAWMTYQYDADGLLYWHVNYWGDNRRIDWTSPFLVEWTPTRIAGTTGDGALTYPGPDGLLPSIRLENIRDGIEDYDCLCLAADRAGRRAARDISRSLIVSMTEFTRDPRAVEKARGELNRICSGASR